MVLIRIKSNKKRIFMSIILIGVIAASVLIFNKVEENAYEASLMIDRWEQSGMDDGSRDGENDG
jgi:hypothetical protein